MLSKVLFLLGKDQAVVRCEAMLARLKGLPEWQVIFRHGVRNGLGPMIQALPNAL